MNEVENTSVPQRIPVDAAALQALPYRAYRAGKKTAAQNEAYIRTMVQGAASWAVAQSPFGGMGVLAKAGTFPESPAARYDRLAYQLYGRFGLDVPASEITDADIEAVCGLSRYCPKNREPADWAPHLCMSLRRRYEAIREEDMQKQKQLALQLQRAQEKLSALPPYGAEPYRCRKTIERLRCGIGTARVWGKPTYTVPDLKSHMVPIDKIYPIFLDEPFFANKENQFASFAGYLGKGLRKEQPQKWKCWSPSTGLWRDANHLGCLTACYVDLDCYIQGFLIPEQTAEYYLQKIDGRWLPRCSALVISGYGVYAVWFFGASDVQQEPDLIEAHGRVEHLLAAMLEGLGADTASTDPIRVLRLPGSVHHKPGRKPKPVYVYSAWLEADGLCHRYQDARSFFEMVSDWTGDAAGLQPFCTGLARQPERAACTMQHGATTPTNDAAAPDAESEPVPVPKAKKTAVSIPAATPPLTAYAPINIRQITDLDGMEKVFYWLFEAEPYHYCPGRRTNSFAWRAAHDMVLLLLYFEPQRDYSSRHLAFYWLATFLLTACPKTPDAVPELLRYILRRMDAPIPEEDLPGLLKSAQSVSHGYRKIRPATLISHLKIQPRTQPYFQGVLSEEERARRGRLRRAAYEKTHPEKHSAAAARRKAAAARSGTDAEKWAGVLCDLANGFPERQAAAHWGVSKGTVHNLRQAQGMVGLPPLSADTCDTAAKACRLSAGKLRRAFMLAQELPAASAESNVPNREGERAVCSAQPCRKAG